VQFFCSLQVQHNDIILTFFLEEGAKGTPPFLPILSFFGTSKRRPTPLSRKYNYSLRFFSFIELLLFFLLVLGLIWKNKEMNVNFAFLFFADQYFFQLDSYFLQIAGLSK